MSETMEKKLAVVAEYREIARYGIAVGIGGGLLTEVLDHIDALAAQLATANERLREAEMLLRVAVCGPVDGGRAMKRRWGADRRAWLAGSAGGGQS